MTDPALIPDLVRAGVDPELIGRVASALLNVRDNVRDKAVREYETERKRNYRKTLAAQRNLTPAQANDGAGSDAENVPQNVPDTVQNHCDLTSSLSSLKGTSEKVSKRESARARGTRLEPGTPLSDVDRAAAIEFGASADRVDAMWDEFLDFWIGVPGQRGTKLNWSATWRNRVRTVISRGTQNGQQRITADKSVVAGADRILERLRSFDRPLDGSGDGRGAGQDFSRLLSQGGRR